MVVSTVQLQRGNAEVFTMMKMMNKKGKTNLCYNKHMQKLLIKNRHNNIEVTEMTLDEFKSHFAAELNNAIESYKQSNKSYLPEFCKKLPTEDDFYFDLRFNFNNFSNSAYSIDKIIS